MQKVICTLFIFVQVIQGYNTIPSHLIYCYRSNETDAWAGYSLKSFIDIIRKIEEKSPSSMEMRILAANLFHTLRVDGITKAPGIKETEFVTPFGINGIMAHKFKLLLSLVSKTPGIVEFEKLLTLSEVCHLHRMLSSSIEPFQRGDERRTCPLGLTSYNVPVETAYANLNRNRTRDNRLNLTISTRPISRCPIETGVVGDPNYGIISPGILIASIAASLQPQNVRIDEFISAYKEKNPYANLETMDDLNTKKAFNELITSLETMDNTYASNLAGDLAEVCVFQGPYLGKNSVIGLDGKWDNDNFPRQRYISENHSDTWEMTDSEILAGIDGLFLAQQTPSLINRIRRLRLSQILDMYYSARGIPIMNIETTLKRKRIHKFHENLEIDTTTMYQSIFENSDEEFENTKSRLMAKGEINRACNRKDILETINIDKIKQETFNLAQVLQYLTSSVVINSETMRRNCDAAVENFFVYARALLQDLPNCYEIPLDDQKPNVDLTLIVDGYRNVTENKQLISHVAELIDINKYSSYISVVDGSFGQYMVNRTNEISNVFEQMANMSENSIINPQLSLSNSFATILPRLSKQIDREHNASITGGNSLVILVISQGSKILQNDFNNAKSMMDTTFLQFPDLYFVFITNDKETFKELTTFGTRIHLRKVEEHYHIIESSAKNSSDFSQKLEEALKRIPKRLMSANCKAPNLYDPFKNLLVREEYEDYLSPNIELQYRISSTLLQKTNEVKVQFQSVSYGEFTVCSSRNLKMQSLSCQSVLDDHQDNIWFNFTKPCEYPFDCPAIYFTVSMDKTFIKCTENDCRYPDQVRFFIKTDGLRCIGDKTNDGSICVAKFSLIYLLTFYVVFAIKIFIY